MKKLSIILIISLLFACSKEDTKPTIIKGDINGNWLHTEVIDQFGNLDTTFIYYNINVSEKKFTMNFGRNFYNGDYKQPIIRSVFNYKIDSINNELIYYTDSIGQKSYRNYYLENNNDSIYFYVDKSYGSVRIN